MERLLPIGNGAVDIKPASAHGGPTAGLRNEIVISRLLEEPASAAAAEAIQSEILVCHAETSPVLAQLLCEEALVPMKNR